jgi:hypothetical protein
MEGPFDRYLSRELGVPVDAPRREGEVNVRLSSLLGGAKTRSYRLLYRLYEPSQGDCR